MKSRGIAFIALLACYSVGEAQLVKVLATRHAPIFGMPAENVVMRIEDAGGNRFAVYGNSDPSGPSQPFYGELSRTFEGPCFSFGNAEFDRVAKFLDAGPDVCLVSETLALSGQNGIGISRYQANGTQVYRTKREMTPYNGFERVLDSGMDAAGNIYVLGEAQSSATGKILFLARFFANGSWSWYRTWYQSSGVGLVVWPNGNTEVTRVSDNEITVLRSNSLGATLGTRSIATQVNRNVPVSQSSIADATGLYQTITWTKQDDTTRNLTEKRDLDGATIWSNTSVGPLSRVSSNALVKTSDGVIHNQAKVIANVVDLTSIRYDLGGNELWRRSVPLDVRPEDIPTVTAFTDPYDELYLLVSGIADRTRFSKIAPNGAARWQLSLNTPGFQAIQTVGMTSFSDIMVSSYSYGEFMSGGEFLLQTFQQAPVAATDTYVMVRDFVNTPSRPVIANDRYAASAVITISRQPTHGALQMYSNGVFRYIPNPGYSGPDSFQYTLSKLGLNAASATVNLQVR